MRKKCIRPSKGKEEEEECWYKVVSLGAWFIGIEVEHIDDRRLCGGP